MIRADYHMHTNFSGDGKSSLRDILEAARAKGLQEIAITDHGPSHRFYGIRRGNIFVLRKMIDDIAPEYPDIRILQGLEANILPDGSLDVDDEILSVLDWLNAGYHFGTRWSKDAWFHIRNLFRMKSAVKYNTDSIVAAIERYPIDMITHPGDKGAVEIRPIAEAAARRNTLLEINAPHGFLTETQLREIADIDVRFAICSDAHRPERVGEVQQGIDRFLRSGLDRSRVVNWKEGIE